MSIIYVRIDEQTGDRRVSSPWPMTVETLIAALNEMPMQAIVNRYCDDEITQVAYDPSTERVALY